MVIMRPNSGTTPGKDKAARDRQVKFLRYLRTRTQYLSLALRPQGVRQRWMVEEQRWRGKKWWQGKNEEWWK